MNVAAKRVGRAGRPVIGGVKCSRCGLKGHVTRECPNVVVAERQGPCPCSPPKTLVRGSNTKGSSICHGCGTYAQSETAAILCCIHDPRACHHFVHGGTASKRLPGDWCLWCGDEVLEGQSFCDKSCSDDFATDLGSQYRGDTPALVAAGLPLDLGR